jgi:hypothetical protein
MMQRLGWFSMPAYLGVFVSTIAGKIDDRRLSSRK